MAYKFTGRIKKFTIKDLFYVDEPLQNNIIDKNNNSLYQYFCEFDVDNTIIIEDKEFGIAYNGKELDIVKVFRIFDKEMIEYLQTFQNEKFEIKYDYYVLDGNGEDRLAKSKDEKDSYNKIIKVTVLK